MCPPDSVKKCVTPSFFRACAIRCPPCLGFSIDDLVRKGPAASYPGSPSAIHETPRRPWDSEPSATGAGTTRWPRPTSGSTPPARPRSRPDREDEFQRTWRELVEGVTTHELLQDAHDRAMPWEERFRDPARLEETLRGAGLHPVTVQRREYRFRLSRDDYVAGRETTASGRFL